MLVYIFTTAKSFEYVIVFFNAILFLLITVYITLRQARKLLESYIVKVVDVNGQKVTPDGLRLGNQTESGTSYQPPRCSEVSVKPQVTQLFPPVYFLSLFGMISYSCYLLS
jgi:hypothetical protein